MKTHVYIGNMAVAVLLCLASCSEVTYPFRQKEVKILELGQVKVPPREAELKYIRERQEAAKVKQGLPKLGLAFSGGGVRSATICLGALQALETSGVLKHVDYLSTVSGGGYIGSWYVTHLRTEQEINRLKTDEAYKKASQEERDAIDRALSTNRRELLGLEDDGGPSPIEIIREHGGLWGKGFEKVKRASTALGWLLVTIPPNLVQDFALHFKPVPGKWNLTHPIFRYRYNLEKYYFPGWQHRPALWEDVNQEKAAGKQQSETPYYISCAALGNERLTEPFRNSHFEFSKYHCGSEMSGWIATPYFNRPVDKVDRYATQAGILPGAYPGTTTNKLRVSTAVAASGAALDGRGVADKPHLAVWLDNLLTIANLNLRLLTPNPGQDRTGVMGRVFDRAREVTTDRLKYGPRSNTLLISDGGHHENLAMYALVLREVPWIMAFDAGQDGNYKFSDLRTAVRLFGEQGYEVKWRGAVPVDFAAWTAYEKGKGPKPKSTPPKQANFRFDVMKAGKITSRVIYTKSCLPQSAEKLEQASIWAEHAGKNDDFPHIGTLKIDGWNKERFDASRAIGYGLARQAALEHQSEMKLK